MQQSSIGPRGLLGVLVANLVANQVSILWQSGCVLVEEVISDAFSRRSMRHLCMIPRLYLRAAVQPVWAAIADYMYIMDRQRGMESTLGAERSSAMSYLSPIMAVTAT